MKPRYAGTRCIIECFWLHRYIFKNNKVGVPLQKLFCSFWDSVVKRKQKRVKKPKDISIKIRAEKEIRKINMHKDVVV